MRCTDGNQVLPGGFSSFVEDDWIDRLIDDLLLSALSGKVPTLVEDINFHTQYLPLSLGE